MTQNRQLRQLQSIDMKYKVARIFPTSPPVHIGQAVDAGSWRNRFSLVRQGYLVPLETPAMPEQTAPAEIEVGPLSVETESVVGAATPKDVTAKPAKPGKKSSAKTKK